MAFLTPPFPTFADWSNPINRGLVGAWLVNEKSGDTAHDSLGNNNGTLISSPTWVPSLHDGALLYDGASDYVECGKVGQLDGATGFSIVMWIRRDEAVYSGFTGIFGRGPSGRRVPWIFGNNGNANILIQAETTSGSSDINMTLTGASVQGQWYQIAVTWDGATKIARRYVDGVEEGTDPTSGSVFADITTETTRIGGISGFATFLGAIGTTLAYSRALIPSEIQLLYADSTRGFRPRVEVFPAAGAPPGNAMPMAIHHYQMAGAL